MSRLPVILIFDIGKTNKKVLLFNEQYKLVYESDATFTETADEDGFPCEDVYILTSWIRVAFNDLLQHPSFEIKAVNFSAYGASFVYLDEALKVCLPLYNYLKPYSVVLQKQFYETYGGGSLVSQETASPVLGSLNSGLQLYRIKYESPAAFDKIKYALHLPQYISFILSRKINADITSIGCHTTLWDFQHNKYHRWVIDEDLVDKLPGIKNSKEIAGLANDTIPIGVGLHDSSGALVPYLYSFKEPFVLLSTGTWCISLNPFNHTVLTDHELKQDCLCYLSIEGKSVKASRLFAGYEHEQQVKQLAERFNVPIDSYKKVTFNAAVLDNDLSDDHYEAAYHQLIASIIAKQVISTRLILQGAKVKKIFVDGGFSKNAVYMHLLANAFPEYDVFAASVPQASALGAALSIHASWNSNDISADLIGLKHYAPEHKIAD